MKKQILLAGIGCLLLGLALAQEITDDKVTLNIAYTNVDTGPAATELHWEDFYNDPNCFLVPSSSNDANDFINYHLLDGIDGLAIQGWSDGGDAQELDFNLYFHYGAEPSYFSHKVNFDCLSGTAGDNDTVYWFDTYDPNDDDYGGAWWDAYEPTNGTGRVILWLDGNVSKIGVYVTKSSDANSVLEFTPLVFD